MVIISTQNRQRYIEALVQGQQLNDWDAFCHLVVEATKTALVELLSVLATTTDTQTRNVPLFQDILNFLRRQDQA